MQLPIGLFCIDLGGRGSMICLNRESELWLGHVHNQEYEGSRRVGFYIWWSEYREPREDFKAVRHKWIVVALICSMSPVVDSQCCLAVYWAATMSKVRQPAEKIIFDHLQDSYRVYRKDVRIYQRRWPLYLIFGRSPSILNNLSTVHQHALCSTATKSHGIPLLYSVPVWEPLNSQDVLHELPHGIAMISSLRARSQAL